MADLTADHRAAFRLRRVCDQEEAAGAGRGRQSKEELDSRTLGPQSGGSKSQCRPVTGKAGRPAKPTTIMAQVEGSGTTSTSI